MTDKDLLAFVTGLDPAEISGEEEKFDQPKVKKERKKQKANVKTEPLQVSMEDLTNVLDDSTGFSTLKKNIERLADESDEDRPKKIRKVEAPLPKVYQDRIDRKVALQETTSQINKWTAIVRKNRNAKNLSFPLPSHPEENEEKSGDALVESHTPETQFEVEMATVLQKVGSEAQIMKFEEMEMNKLSREEVEKRYQQLAKDRSLLFFRERKQKHQSKIKSKTYRKIKAKSKPKAEDPLDDQRLKAELARAKERLTLKTRKANQWAQEMIHRKGLDSQSRQEIVEQLRNKERLRQEIFGVQPESEESESEYLSDAEAEAGKDEEEFEESENEEECISEAELPEEVAQSDKESEDDGEEKIVGRQKFGQANEPKETKKLKMADLFQPYQPEGEQQKLVREAFMADGAVDDEDFEQEKQALLQAEQPQTIDMTLPGWGSWGGHGIDPAKQKVKVVKKVDGIAVDQRKDRHLKHVIISEKQNRTLNREMSVPKVPFQYKSKEEYERKMAQPLGPEWNSTTTFQKQIKPRVQIKVGSVIDPIKFKS